MYSPTLELAGEFRLSDDERSVLLGPLLAAVFGYLIDDCLLGGRMVRLSVGHNYTHPSGTF